MKTAGLLLISIVGLAQPPVVRNERWGMSKIEVVRAEKAPPVKRHPNQLTYVGIEEGIRSQVLFVFTADKLDQISFVADGSQDPEVALLTWCVYLTKRYGHGVVYQNAKPLGDPALVLDPAFKEFWKQKSGEVLVVFPPEGNTYTGVGIKMVSGFPSVEMDFTDKTE